MNFNDCQIFLGQIPVGEMHPPIFLAEIGTLFNQNLDTAQTMIKAIASAASKAKRIPIILKGEILHDKEICLNNDTTEIYTSKNHVVKKERYRDLIERKVITLEQYRSLFKLCLAHHLPFIVSIYDFAGADFAKEMGAVALKIASGNVPHIPLIRYVGSLGLPLLIDSGRASLSEVATAVNAARQAGCQKIIVEHSPDGHPAQPEDQNLRLMQTYAQAFDVPVGLSDHHVGEEMLYLAIGLGASILEKNVSIDPNILEQDTAFSISLEEIPIVLNKIYNCWIALGKPYRDTSKKIKMIATSTRMGLISKIKIKKGDILTLENVKFAFPCKGIGVQYWDLVNGWKINCDLAVGAIIDWIHVNPTTR